MKILAIDSTETACSAALLIGEECTERYELAPRRHSELILPMLNHLLADAGLALAQLDGIAFGRGPGSFTGVRIAASVAQGIAVGADLPLVPVSSLAALALGGCRQQQAQRVLAGFDARMGEIYAGVFTCGEGVVQALQDECVCAAERLEIPGTATYFAVGSAWQAYPDVLRTRLGSRLSGTDADSQVHARDIAGLALPDFRAGRVVAPENALPVYLRNDVARKRAK